MLVSLLIGRILHRDNIVIADLLEQSIDVVCHISVANIRIVIMCLYLRSLRLRTGQIDELETVVKYAAGFGEGADFSNLRTGPLFARGLLMYNGTMDRVEGQILRNHAQLFDVDAATLGAHPGDDPESRKLVYQRLNLTAEQAAVLEAWGRSQCGRATATGIGWATAAAYIERQTGQPADWERAVA